MAGCQVTSPTRVRFSTKLRPQGAFHFQNELDIHKSSKNYEKSVYNLDLDLLTSYTNRMFCNLGELG